LLKNSKLSKKYYLALPFRGDSQKQPICSYMYQKGGRYNGKNRSKQIQKTFGG
jgi:hypothetical protein